DISGGGIYNSCSSINSGGNHMVTITGWETVNGKRIAQVWNSWGQNHGVKGVSRIQWECGDGKLNRGLGLEARVIQYFMPCEAPQVSFEKSEYVATRGGGIKLGRAQKRGVTCHWSPSEGLSDPDSCETTATPEVTTEYHLEAKNSCGTSSAMTLVIPDSVLGKQSASLILTPYGLVKP
ncbi:MAG: C1 family peptidase, partial [Verrucomicrobiales bacterium]